MTVYIEYVLIDNFIIDYALLKVALNLNGIKVKRWRLFCCAFLGAGLSLVYPLLDFSLLISLFVKLLSGGLLVMLSAKFKSVKQGYKTALTFILLTFAVGGGIIAVFSAFNLSYGAEISVALMFLPAFLLIKFSVSVVRFLVRKGEILVYETTCEITLKKGETIECKGFLDTGNAVYFRGSPVVMANKEFAINIMAKCLPKTYQIFYSTASGKAETSVFFLPRIKIYLGKDEHIINGVYMGVAKERISDSCDLLLHPDMIKEIDNDKRICQVEKVS